MRTKRKALLLTLSALVLVAASILGTVAYLTSTTGPVTNTFTVGSVAITLDEADVNEYGDLILDETETPVARVYSNEYKLIPGRTYTKDPVVHVQPGSEPSYIFVKVENGLTGIEGPSTIASQMTANGWTLVPGETNIYSYKDIIDARAEQDDLTVFNNFTVSSAVTAEALSTYTTVEKIPNITITAYAIQADGLTAEEAFDQLFPAP